MTVGEASSTPFTDIESLYAHLEEAALDYKFVHDIAYLFVPLRDQFTMKGEPEAAKKAQWEIEAFSFCLRDGELRPKWTGLNEQGEKVDFPAFLSLNEAALEYFDQRLAQSRNHLLRARYGHILWSSSKKHRKYAQAAVEAYLALVKDYEARDSKDPEGHFGLGVLDAVTSAYRVAVHSGCCVQEAYLEVRRLISEFSVASGSAPALKINLIKLMLNESRRIPSAAFCGVHEVCWETAQQLRIRGNLNFAIDLLRVGEKVDAKTGRTSHPWKRQAAEWNEVLMAEAESRKNLACMHFCQEALRIYREIGAEDKVKELQERYDKLRNAIPLTETKFEFDVTENMKNFRQIADGVTSGTPESIVLSLACDAWLPKRADLEKEVEARKRSPEFIIGSKSIIDTNGHTAQHFVTDDEKAHFALLQAYGWAIRFTTLPLFNEIMRAGIDKGKLSPTTLLGCLRKHSWLGKSVAKKLPSGESIENNWGCMIAPAVNHYFQELLQASLDPHHTCNFILCIDSLAVRLEGILRDLCSFRGGTTFLMTQDEVGRPIAREKDANALLRDQALASFLPSDDLLFLQYLLVEKAGLNLRNKVAHSLMLPTEYTVGVMHLLVLAVLRLGRFVFRDESATGEACDEPTGEQPPQR